MGRPRRPGHNVGRIDRIVRGVLGVAGIAAWLIGGLPWFWGIVVGLVGAGLVITAVAGSSPLYRLIGVQTRNPDATR